MEKIEDFAVGSITVGLERKGNEGFDQHLKDLRERNKEDIKDMPNVWLHDYWDDLTSE